MDCSSPLFLPNMQTNKRQETQLNIQCLVIQNRLSIMRQFCTDISGMRQCIMHGQKHTSRGIKCLHMPLSAADMEPDASLFLPKGNYSSPRGVGGPGCGRGDLCFCVSKEVGVVPDVCSAEPAQHAHTHLNITAQTWPLTSTL